MPSSVTPRVRPSDALSRAELSPTESTSPARRPRPAGTRVASAPLVLLALLVTAWMGTGCQTGSGGARSLGEAGAAVTLQEGPQKLVLLSDGYLAAQGVPGETAELRRDAFYSVARENGLVKVTTDERMADLVSVLLELGYDSYADGSAAPTGASIDLEVNGSERSAPKPDTSIPSQIDRQALADFTNMKGAFVTVFNETRAYQNVNSGDFKFEQPKLSDNLMRHVTGVR